MWADVPPETPLGHRRRFKPLDKLHRRASVLDRMGRPPTPKADQELMVRGAMAAEPFAYPRAEVAPGLSIRACLGVVVGFAPRRESQARKAFQGFVFTNFFVRVVLPRGRGGNRLRLAAAAPRGRNSIP